MEMKTSIFDGILNLEDALREDPFGEVVSFPEHKGTAEDPIPMGYISYSNAVGQLVEAIYAFVDANPDYDLRQYHTILEEYGYEDVSPLEIDVSKVDSKCLMAMFVWLVRGERFSDGLILDALKAGVVQRWMARLREIRD
ncbi:MAG: DUF6508 domain-containing protein [Lachnospiraceae bacterium]|nr:DUF6508 domain-containing protein [Lachnospiraceae bacterium]